MKFKNIPPDPIGAAVAYVVAILSAFHLPESLGLTADEMGIILGAVGGLIATIRGVLVSRSKREDALEDASKDAQASQG